MPIAAVKPSSLTDSALEILGKGVGGLRDTFAPQVEAPGFHSLRSINAAGDEDKNDEIIKGLARQRAMGDQSPRDQRASASDQRASSPDRDRQMTAEGFDLAVRNAEGDMRGENIQDTSNQILGAALRAPMNLRELGKVGSSAAAGLAGLVRNLPRDPAALKEALKALPAAWRNAATAAVFSEDAKAAGKIMSPPATSGSQLGKWVLPRRGDLDVNKSRTPAKNDTKPSAMSILMNSNPPTPTPPTSPDPNSLN